MKVFKSGVIKLSLLVIIIISAAVIFRLAIFKTQAEGESNLQYDATYGSTLQVARAALLASSSPAYGLIVSSSSSKSGIGTLNPVSTLSVGGAGVSNTGIFGSGVNYGIYGTAATGVYGEGTVGIRAYTTSANIAAGFLGGSTGIYGLGTSEGLHGKATAADGIGLYGEANAATSTGIYGDGDYIGVTATGTYYGGYFVNGSTGVYAYGSGNYGLTATGVGTGILASSCTDCSVLAEMVEVSETPDNGDIMCLNPDNGSVEVCRTDKDSHLKGIAQKYAESIMRMGCSKATDSPDGENFLHLGVMNVDAWKQKPECQGWYPIALSGLSEQTNVVCHTPQGKPLRYGDILVSSSIPGHLRPLDEGESVEPYQIAGQANSLCQPDNNTDSIMVWVK